MGKKTENIMMVDSFGSPYCGLKHKNLIVITNKNYTVWGEEANDFLGTITKRLNKHYNNKRDIAYVAQKLKSNNILKLGNAVEFEKSPDKKERFLGKPLSFDGIREAYGWVKCFSPDCIVMLETYGEKPCWKIYPNDVEGMLDFYESLDRQVECQPLFSNGYMIKLVEDAQKEVDNFFSPEEFIGKMPYPEKGKEVLPRIAEFERQNIIREIIKGKELPGSLESLASKWELFESNIGKIIDDDLDFLTIICPYVRIV